MHVVGVGRARVIVEIGDIERGDCDDLAVRQLVDRAVGRDNGGANLGTRGVGREPVGPHHAYEGLADRATVGVTVVDRRRERPRVHDVRASGQRLHLGLRQGRDLTPSNRSGSLALQRPDNANRNRRRAVHRIPEVADQIHRLTLVRLVRRELKGAGRGRDASIASHDLEVRGLNRRATDEPVEGDGDVVETLFAGRTADRVVGTPRRAQDSRLRTRDRAGRGGRRGQRAHEENRAKCCEGISGQATHRHLLCRHKAART